MVGYWATCAARGTKAHRRSIFLHLTPARTGRAASGLQPSMSSLSSTTAARAGRSPRAAAWKTSPEKVSARMRITHLVSYSRNPFLPTAHCSRTQQKCVRAGMRFWADVGVDAGTMMQLMYSTGQIYVSISSGVIIRIWWPRSDRRSSLTQRLARGSRASADPALAHCSADSAKRRRIHGHLCDRCGYMREHRAVRHGCSRCGARECPLGNVINIGDCLCEMTAWRTSTEHRRLRVASSW